MCGDFLGSLGKGARVYFSVDDEGAGLAKALMWHRLFGDGEPFVDYGRYNKFMISRPEIQRKMHEVFRSLALRYSVGMSTGVEKTGRISENIRDVKLNELESMRWTLHGAHRIEMKADYYVGEIKPDFNKVKYDPRLIFMVVIFSNIQFIWIDRADLHPGTKTMTDTGQVVDDKEFTGAGSDFDIRIHFSPPSQSVWQLVGGDAKLIGGWPEPYVKPTSKYDNLAPYLPGNARVPTGPL